MKRTTIRVALFASLILAAVSARADAVEEWTRISRDVVTHSKADATARLAMLALAADAISEAHADSQGDGRSGSIACGGCERREAAVSVAAFVILERLVPDQREELASRLAVTFSRIAETDAKADGAALGRRIAARLLR